MLSESGKSKRGKTGTIAADRAATAVRLRRTGLGYAAIAQHLGLAGPGSAYKCVARGLRSVIAEEVEPLRQLELERLDRLHEAVWPRALNGDLRAADRVVAIMDRRCRLLGLDQIVRIDIRKLVREIAERHQLTDDESRVLFDDLTAYLDRQRSGG